MPKSVPIPYVFQTVRFICKLSTLQQLQVLLGQLSFYYLTTTKKFETSSSALDKLFSHKTTLPPSTAPKYCDEAGTREGCFLTQRLLHRSFRVSLLAQRICSQLSLHLSHHWCLSNRCDGAITLSKCNQGRFLSGLPQCCAVHTHTSKHKH